MAILVLTSTAGSPGVTSLAVGLALTWPRSVLLVDADPGAHQAVLAGFLAGQSADGKGLVRVAEAHRDRRPLREVVLDQSVPLTVDGAHRRRFLPGFSRPGSAALFTPVWPDLADTFDRLDDTGIDVIIDAGRCSPAGLPVPLVEHAALVGLVLRSQLRAVMSARVHLPSLQELTTTGPNPSLGLIVVGEGAPYSQREIAAALGVPVLATIADDPVSAAHLSDGRARSRKFDLSPLAKSLHTASTRLASGLHRTAELIRS